MLSFLFLATLSIAYKPWPYDPHCPQPQSYNNYEEYLKLNPNGNRKHYKAVSGVRVNLTSAMNGYGAVCLDGSVPVFYWRPGTGNGVNKFHVYFQGGGWCAGTNWDYDNCQDSCLHRSTTNLGSSKTYASQMNYDSDYMSTSSTTNPVSYNWNTIYVPYCDGGSYTGNNESVTTVNNTKLYFRGFRILNGVFQELANNYKWGATTTDVLISGCSAGGLTTWLHSQYIYDTFVKPFGIKNYQAMPDSGFFLEYVGGGKYVESMTWVYNYMNGSGSINQACMDANKGNEYKCIFAQNVAPYNTIKTFPLQSRYDSWQTSCILGSSNVDDINKYGDIFEETFSNNYLSNNMGLHDAFFDACHHHCGYWDGITINDKKSNAAQLESWNNNGAQGVVYYQNAQYPCSACCS